MVPEEPWRRVGPPSAQHQGAPAVEEALHHHQEDHHRFQRPEAVRRDHYRHPAEAQEQRVHQPLRGVERQQAESDADGQLARPKAIQCHVLELNHAICCSCVDVINSP